MKNKIILLTSFILLFLGLFLRLNNIDKIPIHLSNDEISIAYDAYNVNKTGKDEYGTPYPISFRSQDTYKSPAYSYILSLFFNKLPNTDLTARIPSIISGLLGIFFIGLLTFKLTNNINIAYISSALLAITPWHIVTSRMILEANIGLTIFLIALYLFFQSISNKKINLFTLILSGLFMSLSAYSYHTHWIYSPLIIIILSLIYLKKFKKIIIILALSFIIFSIPLIGDYVNNLNTGARANSQLLWKESQTADLLNRQNLLINKISIVGKQFISNYFTYTNPAYLFFKGLGLFTKNNLYELGLFISTMAIPFIVGLFKLKTITDKKHRSFLIIFLLSAPIVVSMTHGGNILRNLIFIIPSIIIMAIGYYNIFLSNQKLFYLLNISLIMGMYFFHILYTYHSPKENASSYQGYKPIAQYLKNTPHAHSVIDYHFGPNDIYIGVPHYYIGYYNEINPINFHQRLHAENKTIYGNFTIQDIVWHNIKIQANYLYIVPRDKSPPLNIQNQLELEKTFYDYNHIKAFEIWRGL